MRLYEEILTEEELEKEMDAKAEAREKVLLYTADMLHDAGFENTTNANTINYEQSGENYKALFSIDTTTFNYKCYVTVENEESSSTYSAHGTIEQVEEALPKFLSAVADVSES